MSDDFDKGYFSHGAGSGKSHEFQQGVWARQEEERRAREAAERAQRERDDAWARQMSDRARDVNPGFWVGHARTTVGGAPAGDAGHFTRGGLARAVKNGAFAGAVLFLLYAFVYTPRPEEEWLARAIAGGVAGAVAGGALYVALIVLRWVLIALAWVLGFLLLAAVVGAGWKAL